MAEVSLPITIMSVDEFRELLDSVRLEPALFRWQGRTYRLTCVDNVIDYAGERERVLKILDETAGSWADLDADQLIEEIYEARQLGSRPPDRPFEIR